MTDFIALIVVALARRGGTIIVGALRGHGSIIIDSATLGSRRTAVVVTLAGVIQSLAGTRIVIKHALGARRGSVVIVFFVIGAAKT